MYEDNNKKISTCVLARDHKQLTSVSKIFVVITMVAITGASLLIGDVPVYARSAPVTSVSVKTPGTILGVDDCFTVDFVYASTSVFYLGMTLWDETSTTSSSVDLGEVEYNGASYSTGCIYPSRIYGEDNKYKDLSTLQFSLRNSSHSERGYFNAWERGSYPALVYSSTSTHPVSTPSVFYLGTLFLFFFASWLGYKIFYKAI